MNDQLQDIHAKTQDIHAKTQDIDKKVMVNLIPSPSLLPSNPRTGLGGPRPSQWLTSHHERWAPLREQTGVSEGNEEGGPRGHRPLARKRRRSACFLAQRSGWDREINHCPIVRRDNLREQKARGKLLLLPRLRGPQQSPDDLPNPRLPARLPISPLSTKLARSFEGAP